jgi:glycerol-3-phosphate dehydrogenase
MIRAGLFLYDHLGGRRALPPSRAIHLDGDCLRPASRKIFSYWDARVQDSRLVVLNAIDAAERGATILTRTELIEARREQGAWNARLGAPGGETSVRARALVNAAGAWASQILDRVKGAPRDRKLRLVKGSHIVVPQLYNGDHAFLLQNADGRVVFAIPFEQRFTLIGTTDVEWRGSPGAPTISEDETNYLLGTVARYFTAELSSRDIVWSYSGIRALVDDGASELSKLTRDYLLELDAPPGQPPLLIVYGGKITTYRRLAERAVEQLRHYFPEATGAWTNAARLPGGDIPDLDVRAYEAILTEEYRELPPELLARFVRTYGTRTRRLLDRVHTISDLGQHFGGGLYAREVDYLVRNEWARTAEDVLFRRTKLGLHVGPRVTERLTAYLS